MNAPLNDASIAVGLPVFNGSAHLEQAIRSVLQQTSPPTTVLVFDNASSDSTVQIAARLLGTSCVRTTAENMGAVWNFNRAVQESPAEFFLWLASDDYLEPNHLELCLDVLRAHPGRPACLPGIRFVGQDGRPLRTGADPGLGSPDAKVRFRSYLRRMRWTETYCLFRRDALLRSPMLTQEFGSDVLLMWWFLLRTPLAIVDKPLLNYREYTKSISEVEHTLNPTMRGQHWRKCRLWCALWKHTGQVGVDSEVARIARTELLLFIPSRWGVWHLVDDCLEITASILGRHPVTRRAWAKFFAMLRVLLRRPQT